MLRQRIITAIIVAPIVLACVFLLPPTYFAVFVGAILTVSAWEWANLAGLSARLRYVYAALVALALVGCALLPVTWPLLALGMVWWTLALILVWRYPDLDELWGKKAVLVGIGFVILLPGFVALNVLKSFDHSSYLICLLFFLIWGADIGAYFSGRAFGKAKLAPRVSPGKSWAGVYGGVVTAVVIAGGMATYFGSPALMSASGALFMLVCMFMALISVLGDLTISMFKRHRDIKDSSNLLPGHGGFLDRIDSLLSATPAFVLYLLFASWL